MKDDSLSLVREAAQAIVDKKGFNVMALDVRGLSTITDFMIFAEGNVDRHVKAISSNIREVLRLHGRKPIVIEGDDVSEWIVMDYGDIIVHIFTPFLRQKYSLENVWFEGNIIELDLKSSPISAEYF